MSEQERVQVSLEDGLAMMEWSDDEHVHTFIQAGPCLVGADWSKEEIIEESQRHGLELAGDMATNLHHGLVIMRPGEPVFVATKQR